MGLVILGSDKTHLNKNYGDKEVHCVYLSCGNIDQSIRTKASAGCWLMIAQIPVIKFKEKHEQNILEQRLYHQCMNIALEALKACSNTAVKMSDAKGELRLLRTFLLSHIADLPEQQLIACVTTNTSPISMAMYHTLGDGEAQGLRHGASTLLAIKQLRNQPNLDLTNLSGYLIAAGKVYLNGVLEPFWEGWKYADPARFLTPEPLHQWHIFFYEHVMLWARALVTNKEIDRRYQALQRRVGYRHFNQGFTRYTMHTGREHRDLQRSFIAVLHGHYKITPEIHQAFTAIINFIYLAQLEPLTERILALMDENLALFHAKKRFLSGVGLRDGTRMKGGFKIPKLELLHHVCRAGRDVGSMEQFSADQTEHLHIPNAKVPYRATNKKDFEEQMCRFVDRKERVRLFTTFLEWRQGENLTLPETFLPPPPRNSFLDDAARVPRNETTAFKMTDRVSLGDVGIRAAASFYCLPHFRAILSSYHRKHYGHLYPGTQLHLPFQQLDTWQHIHLQLRSAADPSVVLEPFALMAAPPSKGSPYGWCNFALVKLQSNFLVPGLKGPYLNLGHLFFY